MSNYLLPALAVGFLFFQIFPDWSVSDVDDCMCELGRNGYLDNHHASDFIYDSSLTDKAIVTMENQKKETLLNVVNFLAQFIP